MASRVFIGLQFIFLVTAYCNRNYENRMTSYANPSQIDECRF